jgi:uncharacterized protein with HEPN domain
MNPALGERDRTTLRQMLDAAQKVQRHTAGRQRSDLDADELLALAVVRLLEIIGEAAKRVPDDVRASSPTLPWRSIGRTRDRLIHGYDSVDLDIVWSIVQSDIPPLVAELERLLAVSNDD